MENLKNLKKNNKVLLFSSFFLIVVLLIFLVAFFKLGKNMDEISGFIIRQDQGENALADGEIYNEESFSKLSSRQSYLVKNISELSPIKEVLGGNFYITEFTWHDENLTKIKYEDGHIALEAEVSFDADSDDVVPSNFVITKEN